MIDVDLADFDAHNELDGLEKEKDDSLTRGLKKKITKSKPDGDFLSIQLGKGRHDRFQLV